MAREEAQFRRWLVQRVKNSRWSDWNSVDLETIAKRLGVQPDVLIDAQSALDEDRRASGRVPLQLGTRNRRMRKTADGSIERFLVGVDIPPVVYSDLQAYCELRQLTQFVVLRSLVSKLLTSTAQPQWMGRGWRYKGSLFPGTSRGARHWVNTDVTAGAAEALARRAAASGVSVAALLKGMIIDLLEGRIATLLIVTTLSQMPDDPDRYVTLEAQVDDGRRGVR